MDGTLVTGTADGQRLREEGKAKAAAAAAAAAKAAADAKAKAAQAALAAENQRKLAALRNLDKARTSTPPPTPSTEPGGGPGGQGQKARTPAETQREMAALRQRILATRQQRQRDQDRAKAENQRKLAALRNLDKARTSTPPPTPSYGPGGQGQKTRTPAETQRELAALRQRTLASRQQRQREQDKAKAQAETQRKLAALRDLDKARTSTPPPTPSPKPGGGPGGQGQKTRTPAETQRELAALRQRTLASRQQRQREQDEAKAENQRKLAALRGLDKGRTSTPPAKVLPTPTISTPESIRLRMAQGIRLGQAHQPDLGDEHTETPAEGPQKPKRSTVPTAQPVPVTGGTPPTGYATDLAATKARLRLAQAITDSQRYDQDLTEHTPVPAETPPLYDGRIDSWADVRLGLKATFNPFYRRPKETIGVSDDLCYRHRHRRRFPKRRRLGPRRCRRIYIQSFEKSRPRHRNQSTQPSNRRCRNNTNHWPRRSRQRGRPRFKSGSNDCQYHHNYPNLYTRSSSRT